MVNLAFRAFCVVQAFPFLCDGDAVYQKRFGADHGLRFDDFPTQACE